MKKLQRDKVINIAIVIFIIEALFLSASFLIEEYGIVKEFGIVKTQTQSIVLSIIGIIYLIVIIGVILWYEWAVYGILSIRISISVLFLIGSSLDVGVIIFQIAMLLITILIIFKILDIKFNI